MAVELYTKNTEDDRDFNPSKVEVRGDVDILINQIRNIFSAESGQVMGASDMTIGIETLVYSMGINSRELQKVILERIYKYATFHKNFKVNVRVKFARGTIRDIVFIDILIDDQKRLEVRVR